MFVLLGFKEIDNSLVGVEFVHQFDFIFGELKIEYIHVLSDTRVGHRLGNRHHTDIELQNKKKKRTEIANMSDCLLHSMTEMDQCDF